MNTPIKNRAFTLVELLIAMAFTVVLMLGVANFYNFTKNTYNTILTQQPLQDGTNIVLSRIINGAAEPGGVVFRLSQAEHYCIGTGAWCGTGNSSAELHFKNPNVDAYERWYKVDNASRSLVYHHPTAANPTGADETIYTAPSGATLTLFFWPPTIANPIEVNQPTQSVHAKVTLTQSISGRTVAGSTSTLIVLRNHP